MESWRYWKNKADGFFQIVTLFKCEKHGFDAVLFYFVLVFLSGRPLFPLRIRPVLSAVFPPEHCRPWRAALLHRSVVLGVHDLGPADAAEREREGAVEDEVAVLVEVAAVAGEVGAVAVADLEGAFKADHPGWVVFPPGDKAFDVEEAFLVDEAVGPVEGSRAEGLAVDGEAFVQEGAVFPVAFLPHFHGLDVHVAAAGRDGGGLFSGLCVGFGLDINFYRFACGLCPVDEAVFFL